MTEEGARAWVIVEARIEADRESSECCARIERKLWEMSLMFARRQAEVAAQRKEATP